MSVEEKEAVTDVLGCKAGKGEVPIGKLVIETLGTGVFLANHLPDSESLSSVFSLGGKVRACLMPSVA